MASIIHFWYAFSMHKNRTKHLTEHDPLSFSFKGNAIFLSISWCILSEHKLHLKWRAFYVTHTHTRRNAAIRAKWNSWSENDRLSLFDAAMLLLLNCFFFISTLYCEWIFQNPLFYIFFSNIPSFIWAFRARTFHVCKMCTKYKFLMLLRAIPHSKHTPSLRSKETILPWVWITFNPLNVFCVFTNLDFASHFSPSLCLLFYFVHSIECI